MAKGGFPRNMGGMGNMNSMIKKAQKMQEEMLKAQEELGEKIVEASVGGGAVSVKVNGKKELIELTISPDAVDPDDVEMLQDMIVAAVNDALKKGEETRESEMSKIGGAGMGGMF